MTFWLGFCCGVLTLFTGLALFTLFLIFSKDDGPHHRR